MAAAQSFLIVFDFDHTLLDCNSDTVIPEFLGKAELQRELMKENMQWTNLVSKLIAPFSKETIDDAARKAVTVHPGIVEMLKFLMYVADQRQQKQVSGALPDIEVCIASDANTQFIETIVREYFPFLRLTSLHTNGFHDLRGTAEATEAVQSKLSWYEPEPGHNCRLCNFRGRPHMCKSRIIQRCLNDSKLIDPTVIFVGDGGNDYCPVLNCLRPRDFVFARLHFPLAKDLSVHGGGCCHIRVWADGDHLGALFQEVLQKHSFRLPSVVCFGDWTRDEFRYISLTERAPRMIRAVIASNPALHRRAAEALERLAVSLETPGDTVLPLPGMANPPQWLQNYQRTHALDATPTNGGSEGSVRWSQIPWLYGEIYIYNLVVYLAHLGDCDEAVAHMLLTPYAMHSPLLQTTPHAEHVARQRIATLATDDAPVTAPVTAAEDAHAIDHPAHRATTTSLDHQYFDPSFLASKASCALQARQPALDVFHAEKAAALQGMLSTRIVPLMDSLLWVPQTDQTLRAKTLRLALMGMLWGNRVDLSFHANTTNLSVASFPPETKILANELDPLVAYINDAICTSRVTCYVDIVLDNAGVELAEDLVFVAWLLNHSASTVVSLHGKPMPFYVSDTTVQDLEGLLFVLRGRTPACDALVATLEHHRNATKRLQFYADDCWVAPMEYRDLPPQIVNTFFYTQRLKLPEPHDPDSLIVPPIPFPESVERRAKSSLVIFKGDLNFRRLVGDRHWDHRSFFSGGSRVETADGSLRFEPLVNFSKCARAAPSLRQAVEDYWPLDVVPIAALRTLKSEVSCGIALEKVDEMDSVGPNNWRVSGEHAVALFSGAPSKKE